MPSADRRPAPDAGRAAGGGPAVAVVVRTRDRPVLLHRALADVCRQTFPDWHVVVVDDGGDPAAVEEVAASHPGLAGRVTLLHNEVSRGMEAASNRGIRSTDSEFIAIHDDDDTWHPAFLQRTVGHLRATGDVAVTVRTEVVWERVDGTAVEEHGREILSPDVHAFSLFELLRRNRAVPISLLYRRALHDEIGLFREDLPVVGDWEFHLRLARTEHRVGFLDGEPLAFWHQRREAEGALANSVIARQHEHRDADLQVRDEALRAYAREHGLGALLYLTKYLERELDRLQERLGQGERRERELLGLVDAQRVVSERIDAGLGPLAERLAALEAAVSDASLVSLGRRRYRRWKARVQRLTSRR